MFFYFMFKVFLKFKIFFIIIGIIIFLIFFHQIKLLLPLENFLKRILLPIQLKIYQTTNIIQENFNFLSFKKIAEENKRLEIEIQERVIEKSFLKELSQENETLRKELNFIKKNNYSF